MIVFTGSDGLEVVTQNDHAALAADLLGLWRLDGLPQSPRRPRLLQAVREHDNGWREVDSAPIVNEETGRPHDFLTVPSGARQELWERGTSRYLEDDPYVALLIVEHGLRIHRSRRHQPDWDDFFERLEERRTGLLDDAAMEARWLASDARLVSLADSLSLILCGRWTAPFEGDDYRARLVGGSTLELDPFPLAGATTFHLPWRRIPRRAYSSDSDLGVELATARWQRRTIRVVPS